MKIVEPSVNLIWATPDALQMIELAGRTCYKSEDKITDDSAEKFVKMLIKRGHEAMIEHAIASFKFVCNRGVTHEMVRHRIASFAQESTRYCDYGDGEIKCQRPLDTPENSLEFVAWKQAMLNAEASYKTLRGLGWKPEKARGVLPIDVKTEIVMTCNFREWRLVLGLRTAETAHPDIRFLMSQVFDWFNNTYPTIAKNI